MPSTSAKSTEQMTAIRRPIKKGTRKVSVEMAKP